jgi:hypothetical protein
MRLLLLATPSGCVAAVVEVFGELAAIRLVQRLADEQCRRMTDVLWNPLPSLPSKCGLVDAPSSLLGQL